MKNSGAKLATRLSHRLVQVQESERKRVALELHDHITQHLCAILVRFQSLADKLSDGNVSLKADAMQLRAMLGEIAEKVERISRDLRPSVLDGLGLASVLREVGVEFADRTGLSVTVACGRLTAQLPTDIELTLYRIVQEALKNVQKHARARHVTLRLSEKRMFIELWIRDDGIGFDSGRQLQARKGKGGLDLFGMHERAAYVGGTLDVQSAPGGGTTVRVRIPLSDPMLSKRKKSLAHRFHSI